MTGSHRRASAFVHLIERVVGRRNLVRVARFLTNQARLDSKNDIATNGEMFFQSALLAVAREPVVVIDVGAHFGEWSTSLLESSKSREIELHAFEPSSFSFARLEERLSGRTHVMLVKAAVSDSRGQAELRIVHEGAGSNSLVPFNVASRSHLGTETVSVTTIGDYCSERAIGRVTLLKSDAEGHDLAVLRGASVMLAAKAIDCVQFEYNSRWIDARRFLADAFDLLEPFGYRLGKVTPRGIEFYQQWSLELETFTESNYVACLPTYVGRLPSVRWWNA